MVNIDVTSLSYCTIKDIYRNGRSKSGHQRYLCQ
ncbi:IS1 family transposase [Xenorhabdus sp. KJ12.1]